MAKSINFRNLATGTALETPQGTGRFIAYKPGNYKKQNVRVELAHGKWVWYKEDALQLKQSFGKQPAKVTPELVQDRFVLL